MERVLFVWRDLFKASIEALMRCTRLRDHPPGHKKQQISIFSQELLNGDNNSIPSSATSLQSELYWISRYINQNTADIRRANKEMACTPYLECPGSRGAQIHEPPVSSCRKHANIKMDKLREVTWLSLAFLAPLCTRWVLRRREKTPATTYSSRYPSAHRNTTQVAIRS